MITKSPFLCRSGLLRKVAATETSRSLLESKSQNEKMQGVKLAKDTYTIGLCEDQLCQYSYSNALNHSMNL